MFVIIRYLEKDKIREEFHRIESVNISVDDITLIDGDPVEIFKIKLKRFDGTERVCRGVSDIEVI